MENQAAALITKYADLAEVLLPRLIGWSLDLAGAIGILIAGWLAARIISGLVRRLLDRQTRLDSTIKPVIASLVRYTILIVVVIAAVAQIGVATTSVLAVLGAAGLAIGLALQGTLSNVAAGVMLLVLRPLRLEEYIEGDGLAGTVKEVGLFNTVLHTPDGQVLFVPNAKLWGSTIRNHSRLGRRRFDIEIRIAYEADVETARAALLAVMNKDYRVLSEIKPDVFVSAMPEGIVVLTMQAWVMASDYVSTIADLRGGAKLALDQAGIAMPFAQRPVYIAPHEELQPRKARGT